MKKTLLVISMSLTSFAYAESNFYISAKTGASISKIPSSVGYYNDYSQYYYDDEPEYTKDYTERLQLVDDKATASLSSFALGTGYILANKRVIRNELEYSYKAEHEFTPFIGNFTSTEIIDDEDPTYGSGANDSHGLKIKNTTQTLMLNSYFDFVNSSKFTPYVNLGLGVARHKTSADFYDDIMSSKSINNFAWSIGAGVAYNINDSLALDLGYKYSNLGDIKVKTNASYEYYDDDYVVVSEKSSNFKFENRSHDLTVGLRYTF